MKDAVWKGFLLGIACSLGCLLAAATLVSLAFYYWLLPLLAWGLFHWIALLPLWHATRRHEEKPWSDLGAGVVLRLGGGRVEEQQGQQSGRAMAHQRRLRRGFSSCTSKSTRTASLSWARPTPGQ